MKRTTAIKLVILSICIVIGALALVYFTEEVCVGDTIANDQVSQSKEISVNKTTEKKKTTTTKNKKTAKPSKKESVVNSSTQTKTTTAPTKKTASSKAVKKKTVTESSWTSYGTMRISYYCRACNSPAGSNTAAIGTAYNGSCASSDRSLLGKTIKVDGKEYYCNDVCGVSNTIDIFVDNDTCVCDHYGIHYSEVQVKN